MTTQPAEDDDTAIWVRSDITPDGAYRIGFSIGPDLAWTLSESHAVRYAVACFAAATTAEHDAAVLALLDKIGLPMSVSAPFIAHDLRRPRRDRWPGGPLQFVPGLTLAGKPFLNMRVHGTDTAQLSPAQLRDHASNVLSIVAAVNLDLHLRRLLVDTLDLDTARARGVVATLRDHWPPEVWPDDPEPRR